MHTNIIKLFSFLLLCSFPLFSMAGSHGIYELSCTSESLRTHVYMELNDEDYADKAFYPRVIVVSVMGYMHILTEKNNYGVDFAIRNSTKNILSIESTDTPKSYIFEVNLNDRKTTKLLIKNAVNPRTSKTIKNLSLECSKVHNI